MRGPVETKVAAGGSVGAAISLLFGLAAQYHWFTPPSPYLTALTVTVASLLAGWLAPHTPRSQPAPAPIINVTGPASPPVVAALKEALRAAAGSSTSTGAGTPVVIQPSARSADPGPIEAGKP